MDSKQFFVWEDEAILWTYPGTLEFVKQSLHRRNYRGTSNIYVFSSTFSNPSVASFSELSIQCSPSVFSNVYLLIVWTVISSFVIFVFFYLIQIMTSKNVPNVPFDNWSHHRCIDYHDLFSLLSQTRYFIFTQSSLCLII